MKMKKESCHVTTRYKALNEGENEIQDVVLF